MKKDKKIKFLFKIIFVLSLSPFCHCSARSAPKMTADQINVILSKAFPGESHRLTVLPEAAIVSIGQAGSRDREETIKAFEQNRIKVFIEGDVNLNGKQDVISVCVSPEEKGIFYLVILEEGKGGYAFIDKLIFKHVFFIGKVKDNTISIIFKVNTDWVKDVVWNGKGYVLKPVDPMAP